MHLCPGRPQLEDLPLQNDEGLVRDAQNPELAVVDRRDEGAAGLNSEHSSPVLKRGGRR
jgi:hypothetical protein